MTELSLDLVQRWLQTVITARGSLPEKLQTAQQYGVGLEDVVAAKRGLAAHQRLSLYTSGYVLRLLECLRADFPALRHFVGDAVFDAFARAYIISRPPQSHSLFDLGAGFPHFLEETKPQHGALQAEVKALLDLPPELARLERARAEVIRAPGTENDPHSTQPLAPLAICSEEVLLQATPCLRLLELKFPLVDFVRRSDQGARPEPPAPRLALIALGRAHYRIHIEEVTRWQAALLQVCAQPVSPYGAVRHAAAASAQEPAAVLAALVVWLPVALACGFLCQRRP